MLRVLGRAMLGLVLPRHCPVCEAPAPGDGRFSLCDSCARALAELIATPHCPRCGRGAGPFTFDADGCSLCRGRRLAYDGLARVGPYAEPLRALILAYKYGRRRDLGPGLGRLLAERVALAPWADLVDLVAPVPLHWTRRFRRGFNQASALARAVAGGARRAVAKRLWRVRSTPHQTRLPPSRRVENVRGAFAVRGGRSAVAGRRILLVDDVLTSGATIGECARVLRRAGAAAVYAAVVAVAGLDERGPW